MSPEPSVLVDLDEPPSSVDYRNSYPDYELTSSGSGFFLGFEDLLCTAAHVVIDSEYITIIRGSLRQKAILVALDRDLDIAILQIEPRGAIESMVKSREKRVFAIRSWMSPRIGERIYAFGFPLSDVLPHALNMTVGLISAEIGIKRNQFQMSAEIQHGNSGGPVLDVYGNIIGMATSSLEPAQNCNFPCRVVK